MEKIIFYGDSNTYGYDPRGFFGMRYPKEVRWTEIVRDRFKGKIEITEEGQNGRSLPEIQREEGFLRSIMGALSDKDILQILQNSPLLQEKAVQWLHSPVPEKGMIISRSIPMI